MNRKGKPTRKTVRSKLSTEESNSSVSSHFPSLSFSLSPIFPLRCNTLISCRHLVQTSIWWAHTQLSRDVLWECAYAWLVPHLGSTRGRLRFYARLERLSTKLETFAVLIRFHPFLSSSPACKCLSDFVALSVFLCFFCALLLVADVWPWRNFHCCPLLISYQSGDRYDMLTVAPERLCAFCHYDSACLTLSLESTWCYHKYID